MANWYIRSLAAGTATGADWTNAKLTLAAALTAGAAGDSFWVSEDHAETQASVMTLTSPGTAASPCFIYCVNHSGTVPPVSADLRTTGSLATTGANNLRLASGYAYIYGLTFSAGSGAVSGNCQLLSAGTLGALLLNNCALVLNNTSIGSLINIGTGSNTDMLVRLENVTMTFGATGQGIALSNARFLWKNTASALGGATFPTTLFKTISQAAVGLCEGVDLSALGSGNTLVASGNPPYTFTFKDCKLGASLTVMSSPSGIGAAEATIIRSDSAGTNYRSEKYQYTGTQTTETTIVRTGGASDGTTPISWKLATTANSKWVLPFEALPIAIWNDTVGSAITVTVYGIWGGGAVPLNDDIWMDVEYLGSTLTPQGSFATTTKADNLATGANTTTDTSTWGGSTTKFKMAVTFTPQMKGPITITVRAAKASSTFYIDPRPVVT